MQYLRSFSIYAFTLFFNAAISFATFSVLTHHLSEVDYGIINLYSSFTVLLTPFIAMGVPFVLSVDYFKLTKKEFGKSFTNALVIPVAACCFFTLLVFLLHPAIEGIVKINFFFTVTLPLGCFLVVLNEVLLNLLRNKEAHLLFGFFSIIKNVLEVALTLLFVVALHYNWQGRIGSSLVALLFAGIVMVVLVFRWRLYSGHFNKTLIGSIVLAGLPFVPERLAIFVLGYSDRFFIDYFNGTAEVGYYSAGAQLALIVNLVIITLNNTFYPGLYKSLSQSTVDHKKIRQIVYTFIAISFLIAVGVLLTIPLFFNYFIGPNFQAGQKFAYYLTCGSLFWAVYNVFIAFLLNHKKNRLIMMISIFGMIISLVVNLFTIRHFGAIGAAYTNIFVYFLMAAVTIFFVNKFYSLKNLFGHRMPLQQP